MIKIGSTIYSVLAANTGITNTIGNKIYPLIAPENTNGSFIVYKRSFTNEANKDTILSTTTIEIIIVSADYKESIELAEEVIKSITSIAGAAGDYYIFKSNNDSCNESYSENGYTQNLVFTIKSSI